jgi:hypothetical protein
VEDDRGDVIGNPAVCRPLARAATAAALILALGGCGGLEKIRVFTVSMVNDTTREVVLRGCDHFCSYALLTYDLQPGESVDVHRTTNQHKYFSITTPSGGRIGCLDLYFKAPQPGAQVPVSSAARCPPGSRLPWRTIALVLLVALPVAGLLLLRPRSR